MRLAEKQSHWVSNLEVLSQPLCDPYILSYHSHNKPLRYALFLPYFAEEETKAQEAETWLSD